MTDPRFLSVIAIFFIGLGIFSIYRGVKQLRAERARGKSMRWYQQINLLTGIEYILLTIVFLLSAGASSKFFPPNVATIVFPIYTILLLGALVLAGMVIRLAFKNARQQQQARAATVAPNGNGQNGGSEQGTKELDAERRKLLQEHKRERRRKAAAARRRRAGKA